MSFDFHHNKPEYFQQQYINAKNYVVPFIKETLPALEGLKVMEIGCAEGGVLKAFTDLNCECTGIELSQSKITNANLFMAEELAAGKIRFICKNIYDVDFQQEFSAYFDLIILKDTIEHIPDQNQLIGKLKILLKHEGQVFFGFPPWLMPWGGHQQICKSKFLMLLPYFHLLPKNIYKGILKLFGEEDYKIKDLIEIKETGINTTQFEQYVHKNGYQVVNKRFYLINPIYLYKFKVKPIKQWKLLENIPYLRDLISTTVYYTIKIKGDI